MLVHGRVLWNISTDLDGIIKHKKSNSNLRCCAIDNNIVCKLETSMLKNLGVAKKDSCSRAKKYMVQCNNPDCRIFAHSQVNFDNKCYTLQLPKFKGTSCFEIVHKKKRIDSLSPYNNKTNI